MLDYSIRPRLDREIASLGFPGANLFAGAGSHRGGCRGPRPGARSGRDRSARSARSARAGRAGCASSRPRSPGVLVPQCWIGIAGGFLDGDARHAVGRRSGDRPVGRPAAEGSRQRRVTASSAPCRRPGATPGRAADEA